MADNDSRATRRPVPGAARLRLVSTRVVIAGWLISGSLAAGATGATTPVDGPTVGDASSAVRLWDAGALGSRAQRSSDTGGFPVHEAGRCPVGPLPGPAARPAPGRLSFAPGATGSGYVVPDWLGGEPNLWSWTTTGAIAAGWAALAVDDDLDTIESVGDVTQMVPLAAGLGFSLGARDWQGAKQLTWSGLTTFGAVHLIKQTTDKYRPDGSNPESFPSGHTAASFAGAAFIQQRYGPKWGIPALVTASYTAYSRVRAQKHFTDDVVSGMSIALFSNWLFVKPADPDRAARNADLARERDFRFEWENPDGNVRRNDVRVPAKGGTPIDFEFEQTTDPQVTASAAFDWRVTHRHNLRVRWAPFEIRDVGVLEEDKSIGGVTLPAGTEVFSVYFSGDFRVRYAYSLLDDSRWTVDLGGGVTYQDTTVELYVDRQPGEGLDVDSEAGVGTTVRDPLPLLYTRLGVDLTRRFGLLGEVDWFEGSGDRFLDYAAKFVWWINPKWDLALGWRATQVRVDTDRLANDTARDGALLHIGYSF